MARFRRRSWKRIISVVLVTVLVVSLGGALISFLRNDTKTIHPRFSLGSLDSVGKHVTDDQSIYTKELFECVGLRVEPEFEAKLTYDIYFYDADETFLRAEKGLSEAYEDDFLFAKYARIVIHPDIPEDSTVNDFKIKWYQVAGYANDINITVDKKQEYLYDGITYTSGYTDNLYDDAKAKDNSGFFGSVDSTVQLFYDDESYAASKLSEKIKLDSTFNAVDVYVRYNDIKNSHVKAAVVSGTTVVDIINIDFYLDSNTVTSASGEWFKLTFNLTEHASSDLSLYVQLGEKMECCVFGY